MKRWMSWTLIALVATVGGMTRARGEDAPQPQPHVERLGSAASDPVAYVRDRGHFCYRTPKRTVTYYASNGDGVIDTIHVDDGDVDDVYLRVGTVFCRVVPRVCLSTTEVFPILLFETAELTQQWLARTHTSDTVLPLAEETLLMGKLDTIFERAR